MNPSGSGPRCPYCGEADGCTHLACAWDQLAFTDPENELRGAGIDSDCWEPFESFHPELHAALTDLAGVWARILLDWLYPDDALAGTAEELARADRRLGPLIQSAAEVAETAGDYDRALWFLLKGRSETLPASFLAFQAVGGGDEEGSAELFGRGFAVSIAKWLHADRQLAVRESRVLWEARTRVHGLYGEDEEDEQWAGLGLGALFAETPEDAEALRRAILAQVEELTRGFAAGLSRVTAKSP